MPDGMIAETVVAYTKNNDMALETEGMLSARDSGFSRWIVSLEWLLVILLGVGTMILHVRFNAYVGGLWRDEANTVQLATLPTFKELWHSLDFDSFPILFFVLLRGWAGIFGAANDNMLRVLGLLMGLTVLAVLWRNARRFGADLPVLSFALVGFNPMVIRYGDSIRAYGLGVVLILLTLYSYWCLVEAGPPTLKKIVPATLFALLSVQCLYYNAVLLLAISAGAAAVALRARVWRTICIVFAIGALTAISLLPYVPMFRRIQQWRLLMTSPVDFLWLWRRIGEVIGSPNPIGIGIWTGLVVIAIAVIAASHFSHKLSPTVLFAGVILIVAIPAYAVFLRVLSYYTQPWYYITLAVLVASTLDVILGLQAEGTDRARFPSLRLVRLLVALTLFLLTVLPAWREIPTRHTNVDLVAAKLKSEAQRDDVIVATHWQYAISLYRYYHGPAQVVTLPFVEDHRFHRYDLALRQMTSDYPLEPAFSRIRKALQAGHRIFFVGMLRFPKADELPPGLALGYRDSNGSRHGGNYDVVWPISAGYFVQTHADNYVQIPVPLPSNTRVQGYEYLPLSMAEGWR